MNKTLIAAIIFFFVVAINTTYAQQNIRDKFLVDKVSVFVDNKTVVTEYIYDVDNKLLTITGQDLKKYVRIFEYENGRISKMIFKDSVDFMFDYDEHYFYDSQGQLVRREEYFMEQMLSYQNFHYENGQMVSTYSDSTLPFQGDSIFYDTSGNVVKRSLLWGFGWRTYYYEYDNNPKPNFGIDYLFVLAPLPGEDDIVANLAKGYLSGFTF